MRQLLIRVEAKVKHDLDGAAIVAAIVASCNSTKRYVPSDFHPYREKTASGTRLTRRNLPLISKALAGKKAAKSPATKQGGGNG